ncbi:MAG: hypothetical protein Q9162_006298 [Coniocarpon cinnabarinum]
MNIKKPRQPLFYYKIGPGFACWPQPRLYFDLLKEQLEDRHSESQIFHAVCAFPEYFKSAAHATVTNAIVVNSLPHVSTSTPEEQSHYTFKECFVDEHLGTCVSFGGGHLYTIGIGPEQCVGRYRFWPSSTAQEESGWAGQLAEAECRGVIDMVAGKYVRKGNNAAQADNISHLIRLIPSRFVSVDQAEGSTGDNDSGSKKCLELW